MYNGELFDEVHQVYNDWLSLTIRLYDNSTNIELEWQVGPIFVDDGGKEVIFKLSSDITSNGIFTTDSNGRQLLKRERDYRKDIPDYYLLYGEKVTSNYYPINTRIFIADQLENKEKRQLTLVTDRSQGASSIEDGSIEIMLHRRLLHDDSLGVDENLNEIGLDNKGLINKGKLYIIFNTTKESTRLHRELSHRVNAQPLITFDCNNVVNQLKWNNMLINQLPSNIHMLTLQQEFTKTDDGYYSIIIRIEHFYEIGDDDLLSHPVSIDLSTLFNNQTFLFINAEELSLGANMKVEELDKRLIFKEDGAVNMKEEPKIRNNFKDGTFIITIEPFQIRTFRIIYNLI
jgi:lysosomal alpha-mannosidase